MSYILQKVAPVYKSSWFTPAECQAYYKKPYIFREIQIHWWDDPSKKPTHDSVVNYTKNKTGGSVNYVASAGKVTLMVPEENCALTTQGGNPYGVKIECSPYGTDADYTTIGQLVAEIRKRHGNLPLVPHNKYWATTCPGTLDLARIDREASKFNGGNSMEERMTATEKSLGDLYKIVNTAQSNIDKLQKDVAALYKIVDTANRNIDTLIKQGNNGGGSLPDGKYEIKKIV